MKKPKAHILDAIQSDIYAELHSAEIKFPKWPHCLVRGAGIVAEECGELMQAALNHRYFNGFAESVYHEALQTAAMALRLMVFLRDPSIYADMDGVPVVPILCPAATTAGHDWHHCDVVPGVACGDKRTLKYQECNHWKKHGRAWLKANPSLKSK